MTTFALILTTLLAIAAVANLWYAYKSDLQMLQQNSYRNDRYFRWWKASNNYYSVNRIIDLIVLLLMLSQFSKLYVVIPIAIIALSTKVILAAKKKYKKPLVFTRRVWRLLTTMLVLSAIVMATACVPNAEDLSTAIYAVAIAATTLSVLSWGILAICNKAMMPVESAINKMYCDDARRILSEMQGLKIIGITGSYGKTSTKHYLYRILSERYNVLMTPGSFNTPMGVVRTVREQMKPYHEVFIVEMGAKQIGDIKEICDLVHPEIGIITAVGEQHLETFGSLSDVYAAKRELPQYLAAHGGACCFNVCNALAAKMYSECGCRALASGHFGDCTIESVNMSSDGSEFELVFSNKERAVCRTALLGLANVQNVALAACVAHDLGVSAEEIAAAAAKLRPVPHRMQPVSAGKLLVIDDSYNADPEGVRNAFDTLRLFGGKRAVATQGIVEGGKEGARLNEELGRALADVADVAIVIGPNSADIERGLARAGYLGKLFFARDLEDAKALFTTVLDGVSVLLIQNDLPDNY